MRPFLGWLLVLSPTLALGGEGGPLRWSPDGRWLAFTAAVEPGDAGLRPGWIFGRAAGAPGVTPPPAQKSTGRAPARRHRLYAAEVETGATVVLAESDGPLTPPAWSPDGRSIAFGRVVAAAAGPDRFEVVVLDETRQPKVLTSDPLVARGAAVVGDGADPIGLRDRAPAWSADGRFLAVADLRTPPGLLVVRADTGRVLTTLEGGSLPAWSPDGTRLAFVRVGKVSSLLVMDASFGPARLLTEAARVYQEPTWTRDGRGIYLTARRAVDRGRISTEQIDLSRVSVDSGVAVTVADLGSDRFEPEKEPDAVCLTINRDGDEMFSTVDVDGEPSVVVWFRPANRETVDRFNPIFYSVRVESLALSPARKSLAIRFGAPGGGSTVALWDLASRRLTPIASDDALRREWVALLATTATTILQAALPPTAVGGGVVARPTILPVPGEIAPNHELIGQLRRIGRYGAALCQRPEAGDEGDDRLAHAASLDEPRLFFDALREDYAAALASLETLEARTTSPEHRRRLLALRAQLFMGLGDPDTAADPIAYLQTLERHATRVESTAAGVSLTTEPGATDGWAHYLSGRLAVLSKTTTDAEGVSTEAPDEPIPALPFAPVGRGLPFPPRPDGLNAPPNLPLPPPPVDRAGPAPPPAPVPNIRPPLLRPRRIPAPPRVEAKRPALTH